MLSLVAVIKSFFALLMLSPYSRIDTLMQFPILASPLYRFCDTFSLSMSSLGCKAFCIVFNYLILWSICLIFSLVHFKNGPEYLISGTLGV